MHMIEIHNETLKTTRGKQKMTRPRVKNSVPITLLLYAIACKHILLLFFTNMKTYTCFHLLMYTPNSTPTKDQSQHEFNIECI
jgi:hypothetical protein